MADAAEDAHEPVVVRRRDAVVTVTLNRPHRKNALDVAAWAGLEDALCSARDDESVRVLVITGAGGDFCAGADLADDSDGHHPLHRMRRIGDIAELLHDMPKPVVAKVDGVAAGAGWNLALGCDLVVASSSARFSQIFSRRGLSPDFGGCWLLPRIVGLQQAKRLALLADFVDAAEALSLGLVTWVKEHPEIDSFVDEVTARLAAGPPVALAQAKELLNAGAAQTFRETLDDESRAQLVNFATDGPAAREAFLARTEPRFEGRWQL